MYNIPMMQKGDIMLFKKKTKYELFWEWFLEKEHFIFDNIEENGTEIAVMIQKELKEVHPDLQFEIPFLIVNEKRDMIVSADGVQSLFDEVVALHDAAPEFKLWNIIAFRPRTYQEDQTIEMEGITLSYEDIYFQYDLTDLPIDINVYIRGYDGKDNRYIHAYFILLDTLVGEYDAVTLIGDTYPSRLIEDDIKDLIPIIKIRELLDELSLAN